jgi:lysine 2,3-aminomutase
VVASTPSSRAQGRPTLIRDAASLAAYLRSRGAEPPAALEGDYLLPLRVPTYYLDLIDWRDPHDPLRRQILPDPAERVSAPDELVDPIGDEAHSPVAGVVHRYPDRALLLLTTACAVHCRFCFRREFVGKPMRTLAPEQLERAYAYLAAHSEVWEVILSGGDVLAFPDPYLEGVLGRLRAIGHVRIVRFHSRVPAVWPERLTEELAELLRRFGPTYLVAHVNHPREVTPSFVEAVGRLVDRGVPVLSQSVLLRGVNDDPATLEALFRRLVEARVKPYYLHHPDLARGTGHFRVTIERGLELMRELRGRVSGLCLPTYVLDTPGGGGKVPLAPQYVHDRGAGRYEIDPPLGPRQQYRS